MLVDASSLSIDPGFSGLCPGPSEEEGRLLRQSIDDEGIRDPIVTWANHDDIVIDGHTRLCIARSLGLPKVPIQPRRFESREAVVNWIIANQLGRRNLSAEQKSYLRGKRYQAEKNGHGGDQKAKAQNGPLVDTAEKLASEYSVGRNTIKRDAEFAEAVDVIGVNVGPEGKAEILAGKSGLTKSDVVEVASAPAASQPIKLTSKKAQRAASGKRAKKAPALKAADTPVLDAIGNEINTPKMRGAFSLIPRFDKLGRDITSIIREVEALADSPSGAGLHLPKQSIISDLKNAQGAIRLSKPYAVCKYCGGKGCEPKGEAKGCKKAGWLPARNKQAYEEGSS